LHLEDHLKNRLLYGCFEVDLVSGVARLFDFIFDQVRVDFIFDQVRVDIFFDQAHVFSLPQIFHLSYLFYLLDLNGFFYHQS
jgi:hypothetical protein